MVMISLVVEESLVTKAMRFPWCAKTGSQAFVRSNTARREIRSVTTVVPPISRASIRPSALKDTGWADQ